jgi:hypothetical protein
VVAAAKATSAAGVEVVVAETAFAMDDGTVVSQQSGGNIVVTRPDGSTTTLLDGSDYQTVRLYDVAATSQGVVAAYTVTTNDDPNTIDLHTSTLDGRTSTSYGQVGFWEGPVDSVRLAGNHILVENEFLQAATVLTFAVGNPQPLTRLPTGLSARPVLTPDGRVLASFGGSTLKLRSADGRAASLPIDTRGAQVTSMDVLDDRVLVNRNGLPAVLVDRPWTNSPTTSELPVSGPASFRRGSHATNVAALAAACQLVADAPTREFDGGVTLKAIDAPSGCRVPRLLRASARTPDGPVAITYSESVVNFMPPVTTPPILWPDQSLHIAFTVFAGCTAPAGTTFDQITLEFDTGSATSSWTVPVKACAIEMDLPT